MKKHIKHKNNPKETERLDEIQLFKTYLFRSQKYIFFNLLTKNMLMGIKIKNTNRSKNPSVKIYQYSRNDKN